MNSKEYIGKVDVMKVSPSGGTVIVSFGDLITEEDETLPAMAIHIKDMKGTVVTEFALRPETFGTLMEAIKELYEQF